MEGGKVASEEFPAELRSIFRAQKTEKKREELWKNFEGIPSGAPKELTRTRRNIPEEILEGNFCKNLKKLLGEIPRIIPGANFRRNFRRKSPEQFLEKIPR